MGVTYHLHEGKTKSGRSRYFAARTARAGVLSRMPDGFEFCESVNGVVSVRRIRADAAGLPQMDVARARAQMARHAHLHGCRIEMHKGEIVVFEPRRSRFPDGAAVPGLPFSSYPRGAGAPDRDIGRPTRYDPVLKFVPCPARGRFSVRRMTYRGDGGWSWPLASGPLHELLARFLGCVGTDEFFELV